MRFTPELMIRIFGQMDSDDENIRAVAFRKAREMLKDHDVTFSMIARYTIDRLREEEAAEKRPRRTPDPAFPAATRETPYIHPRVAWRFALTHKGKRVVRGTFPPKGTVGRLRVISDRMCEFEPKTRILELSLEAEDALYEVFEIERSNAADLAMIRSSSMHGTPFHIL